MSLPTTEPGPPRVSELPSLLVPEEPHGHRDPFTGELRVLLLLHPSAVMSLLPPLHPQDVNLFAEDLNVLSALDGDQVASTTKAFYICHHYSLVFVLDMSPTMMAVVSCTLCLSLVGVALV